MNLKKHIPNTLTLVNLLSGCLAITFIFLGRVETIPYFIAVSLLADFLDGLVARALNVSSPIGKELDSLADMVSFGVLPGIMMVYLVVQNAGFGANFNVNLTLAINEGVGKEILVFFPLLITLFAALRLAKFNIATDQSEEFKGLATPAATLFVLGLFLAFIYEYNYLDFLFNPYVLNAIAFAIALLLVSNLPMFSFKLKGLGFTDNKWQYVFLVLCLPILLTFKLASFSFIIVLYILLNVIRMIVTSNTLKN